MKKTVTVIFTGTTFPSAAPRLLIRTAMNFEHATQFSCSRAKIILTLPIGGDKTTAILCHLMMLISYH